MNYPFNPLFQFIYLLDLNGTSYNSYIYSPAILHNRKGFSEKHVQAPTDLKMIQSWKGRKEWKWYNGEK